MTNIEFEILIRKFRKGDNTLLKKIFVKYKKSCVLKLSFKLAINSDEAEDLFMDAVLVFRTEALKKKIKNTNLEAYLYIIAYRIFLRNKSQRQILQEKINFITSSYEDNNLIDEKKLDALNDAWDCMGDTCKNLLKDYYYSGIKLVDLQEKYGYSSYASIKTTKKRCFAKLKSLVNEKYKKVKMSQIFQNEI